MGMGEESFKKKNQKKIKKNKLKLKNQLKIFWQHQNTEEDFSEQEVRQKDQKKKKKNHQK